MGHVGTFMMAFNLALEYVGLKYRTLFGILIETPFAIGGLIVGLVSYAGVRDWRMLTLGKFTKIFMKIINIKWMINFSSFCSKSASSDSAFVDSSGVSKMVDNKEQEGATCQNSRQGSQGQQTTSSNWQDSWGWRERWQTCQWNKPEKCHSVWPLLASNNINQVLNIIHYYSWLH